MRFDRNIVELSIIATCIYVPQAYGAICHILKPANFENKMHRDVMVAIEQVWPNPIDTISIIDINPLLKIWYYNQTQILPHSNLLYHALQLLQVDITDKFLKLLTTICIEHREDNMVAVAAITECINSIQKDGEDIFTMVEATETYLKKLDAPQHIIQKIEAFSQNVDKGVLNMKRAHQIDHLMASLIDVAGKTASTQNITAAQELAECIAALLLSSPIKIELQNQITTLKNQLLHEH